VRDDLDLPVAHLLDVDIIAQVARAALDLNPVVQELFERAEVEDLVRDRLAAVDGVLIRNLRALDWLSSLGGSFRRCTTSLHHHGTRENLSLLHPIFKLQLKWGQAKRFGSHASLPLKAGKSLPWLPTS